MSADNAARGLAIKGARIALEPSNRLLGLLGHSKNEQMSQTTGTVGTGNLDTNWCHRGLMSLYEMIQPGGFLLHQESCFAVSSTLAYHMATTQIARVPASPAGSFLIWCGHNDLLGSLALDDAGSPTGPSATAILPNFRYVFDVLKSLNRKAIVVCETPAGNTTNTAVRWTGNNLKHLHALNRWLVEYAQQNWAGTVYVLNFADKLFDTGAAATRGDILAALTQDQVHLGARGSWLGAKELKRIAPAIFGRPLRPVFSHMPGEMYDAVHNPYGNILGVSTRNPDLCGFGQTLGSAPGASGGVTWAAGLPSPLTGSVSGLGGTTALTVTPSLVNTATGDWLQLAYSGSVGATSGGLYIDWTLNSTELAAITDGEKTCAFGEYEISQNSTGLQGFALEHYRMVNGGSNYEVIRQHAHDATTANIDPILAEQGIATFWDGSGHPNGQHGQTTSSRILRLRLQFAANGSGIAGTVRVRRLALRKYSALMGA